MEILPGDVSKLNAVVPGENDNESEDAGKVKPLHIAEKLSGVISRQVAGLVMITVMVTPLLTVEEAGP